MARYQTGAGCPVERGDRRVVPRGEGAIGDLCRGGPVYLQRSYAVNVIDDRARAKHRRQVPRRQTAARRRDLGFTYQWIERHVRPRHIGFAIDALRNPTAGAVCVVVVQRAAQERPDIK